MKFPIVSASSMFVVVCTLALLVMSAHAAPMVSIQAYIRRPGFSVMNSYESKTIDNK